MGLLDSVLGSVTGSQQQGASSGGFAGLISMVANNPQLMQAVTSMLSNDGGQGGLKGLIAKFQQAGLGSVVGSWVGHGQNQPISRDELTNVLGPDTMASLAEKLGMSQHDAAGQLSNVLPGLIDKLTPDGQAPSGGLGNSGDLMGILGSLLQKR